MSHTHGNHTIVCDLPTKKRCDERYARWKQEQKAEYEAKLAERSRVHRESGESAFRRFRDAELTRIAEILRDDR